jgi:hypothetical protein
MSDHAFDFLQSWVVENVKAMIEAAGGDLNVYMRAELNRVFNRDVEDRVAQVS